MSQTTNLYDILECSQNSSLNEIKRSYQRLVIEHHPDKQTGIAKNQKFLEIDAAWKILRDTEKRKIYDAQLCEQSFNKHSNIFARLSFGELNEDSSGALIYPCRCGGSYIFDVKEKNCFLNDDEMEIECNECSLVILVRR